MSLARAPGRRSTGRVLTLDAAIGHGRVLLLENIHPDAATRLSKAGYQVETRAGALDEDELIAAVRDVQVLGIRSGTHITDRVPDAAPSLLAIGAFCIGVNQIDLAAASQRGIAVFNAPFSNTRSVVELVLAEIIALTRRLTDKNTQMHAGLWDKSATGSPRCAAGAGHHRLRQHRRPALGAGREPRHDRVLLRHRGQAGPGQRAALRHHGRAAGDLGRGHAARGRPAGNSGLFGETEFAAMKPGSLFLNLSRGFVVDHAALRRNIESGTWPARPWTCSRRSRAAAARSSTPTARPAQRDPHPARGRVHEEAQQDIGEFVAGKLHDYVSCGTTSLSVNLPRVALPHTPGTHRLVHLHRNVPGVLASINQLLAEHGANIEGQLLGTRDELGYVLTDIGTEYPGDMLASLRGLDVTIRLRTTPPS